MNKFYPVVNSVSLPFVKMQSSFAFAVILFPLSIFSFKFNFHANILKAILSELRDKSFQTVDIPQVKADSSTCGMSFNIFS